MVYLERNNIKRFYLYYLGHCLERLCHYSHPIVSFEIFELSLVGLEVKITGNHCNLAQMSMWLDDKYHLGLWEKTNEPQTAK